MSRAYAKKSPARHSERGGFEGGFPRLRALDAVVVGYDRPDDDEGQLEMFGERKVNLQLSKRTQAYLERFKANSKLSDPVLGLAWAGIPGETEERWTIGLYDRKDIREGWMGITPEFDFIVIQEWVLDQVDNKVLDFDERTGTITLEAQR